MLPQRVAGCERGSWRPSRTPAMSRHYPRARTGGDRTSLYHEITNKIIAELEDGRVPWVQPWGTAAVKTSLSDTGRDRFRPSRSCWGTGVTPGPLFMGEC
ncbi:hypothetical protein ACVWY3_000600 [Bradyrhizobium sp. USDA 4486]